MTTTEESIENLALWIMSAEYNTRELRLAMTALIKSEVDKAVKLEHEWFDRFIELHGGLLDGSTTQTNDTVEGETE